MKHINACILICLLLQFFIAPIYAMEEDLSPWYAALKKNNIRTMIYLASTKQDLDLCEEDGFTLLHHAVGTIKNKELTQHLIQAGIDINVRTKEGITPLMFAARRGVPIEIIECFLTEQTTVHVTDLYGDTALHYAAGFAKPDAIQRFLEIEEINTEMRNNDGNTPLHILFLETRKFLRNNAKKQVSDNLHDPMHQRLRIALLLLERNPKLIYIQNNSGEKPFDIAQRALQEAKNCGQAEISTLWRQLFLQPLKENMKKKLEKTSQSKAHT